MKTVGLALAVTGIILLCSGAAGAGLLLLLAGACMMRAGKSGGGAPQAGPCDPYAPDEHWSSVTGRYYGSRDEMRRAEDAHLADVYSDPRFR